MDTLHEHVLGFSERSLPYHSSLWLKPTSQRAKAPRVQKASGATPSSITCTPHHGEQTTVATSHVSQVIKGTATTIVVQMDSTNTEAVPKPVPVAVWACKPSMREGTRPLAQHSYCLLCDIITVLAANCLDTMMMLYDNYRKQYCTHTGLSRPSIPWNTLRMSRSRVSTEERTTNVVL